jgi:hypothetical protein
VELQEDLHSAAVELTERCGGTSDPSGQTFDKEAVTFMCGNILTVAPHLQINSYDAIVSWITILHFTEAERAKLFPMVNKNHSSIHFFVCLLFLSNFFFVVTVFFIVEEWWLFLR